MSKATQSEVKTAELHTEWHDVPAGTRVSVLRVGKDWQGNTIAAVQRLDGGTMPLPNGGRGTVGVVWVNHLLFDAPAQGTEARRAATVEQGVVHDGPVAEPCAHTSSGGGK